MSLASKTDVFNMTVLSLGQTAPIVNADSDSNLNARILRQWYEMALTKTLDRTDWRCLRKTGALVLVQENVSLTWQYKYKFPVGAHKVLAINFANYFPDVDVRPENKLSFEVVDENGSQYLYTNVKGAYAQFIVRPAAGAGLPHTVAEVLALILAELAGPGIITNNWINISEKFLAKSKLRISQAIAADLGNQPERKPAQSSFADARID